MLLASCAPAGEGSHSAGNSAEQDEGGGPYGEFIPDAPGRLPNGGRPVHKVPFPEISDWGSLKINLKRSGCFGTCPAYTVTITGDGSVEYVGAYYVAISGTHRSRVTPAETRALYDTFRTADFFNTFDTYRAGVTDNPAYAVRIAYDGKEKSVIDYVGPMIGMPKEITEIEKEIDRVAKTKKWITGDESTVASLQAEGWDFKAKDEEHLSLIAAAGRSHNPDLVRGLLAAGLTADTVWGCNAVGSAARAGDASTVQMLIAAGAPVHWDVPEGTAETCDALHSASLGGSPQIVRTILTRNPDVNWQSRGVGPTALMLAAAGRCAKEATDCNRAKVVELLINAGADVNLRDENGDGVIADLSDNAEVARRLIAAGAKDLSRVDRNGKTPLGRSYTAEVTKVLLDAGADPWVLDRQGKNAWEAVSITFGSQNGAAVVLKQWMDARPKPQ